MMSWVSGSQVRAVQYVANLIQAISHIYCDSFHESRILTEALVLIPLWTLKSVNSNELRSQLEFHIGFEGFLCFLKEAETIFF